MAIIKDTAYAGLMAWVWAAGWPQLIGEVRDLGLPLPNMHTHAHTYAHAHTHAHTHTPHTHILACTHTHAHTFTSLRGTQSPRPFSFPPCHPTTHFLSPPQKSGKS